MGELFNCKGCPKNGTSPYTGYPECYGIRCEMVIRADERTKTIDDVITLARAEIDFVNQAEQARFVEFMEALKEQK